LDIFTYDDLQKCLSQWPKASLPDEPLSDELMERIRQVLKLSQDKNRIQKADFQALIRHLLLRETVKSGNKISLRIPVNDFWPSASDWRSCGMRVLGDENDGLLITATEWTPKWLDNDNKPEFNEIYSEKIVREDGRCSADPFISEITGYQTFSCPGQREAVRGALLMPPGQTLIVNLPTGSGKSLAGQAPSLVYSEDGQLTLFVVPTVSLAIDQARQMSEYLQRVEKQTRPLAWYSGLGKSERSEIRQRMKNGTQKILFTSPEALIISLLSSVFDVAREGMLGYLVIDEAHLVTQWGDDFRPAFQALAGLRNSLLQLYPADPVRTLLLSATFSEETVETLTSLFGPSEKVQMISAVHIRPEPQYWFHCASDDGDKKVKVLEAIKHAPRPFILYVTTKAQARNWLSTLMFEAGYHRVVKFDGDTRNTDRESIIVDWADNKLDGIVATSAFGVGIDKKSVRTIIHATIPETLDRYYQEVGRGGRDGKPSMSLLVYDHNDWKLPRQLAKPKLISNELGISRWKALFDSRSSIGGDDCFSVDLEAVRRGLSRSTEENVNWNMRTLLLMSRAGFIELEVKPNPEEAEEISEYLSSSPLTTMTEVRIRLKRHDHLREEVWDEIVTLSRDKTIKARGKNLDLMTDLLTKGVEISEVLADLYRMKLPNYYVEVTKVCGGCPGDRLIKTRNNNYLVPIALPINKVVEEDLSTPFVVSPLEPWKHPVLSFSNLLSSILSSNATSCI